MITQGLTAPTAKGPILSGMVRRLKASNGTDAERGAGARFCWIILILQSPEVKYQIVDMAMNASGIRDTARVLHISPTTVISEL